MNLSDKKRTRAQYEQMHQFYSDRVSKEEDDRLDRLFSSEIETKENPSEMVMIPSSTKNLFLMPDFEKEPLKHQTLNQTDKPKLLNPFIILINDNNNNKNQLPSASTDYSNPLVALNEAKSSDFFSINKSKEPLIEVKPKVEAFEKCIPIVYSLMTKAKFLCEISEYNFTEKKYISKGKGNLSLEVTENGKEFYAVFRNTALNVIFQARVVPSITTISVLNKQYNFVIIVNKLLMKDDKDKISIKAVRIKLLSEGDMKALEEMLNDILGLSTDKANVAQSNPVAITPLSDNNQCNEKPKGRIIAIQNESKGDTHKDILTQNIPQKKKNKLLIRCVKINETHTSSS